MARNRVIYQSEALYVSDSIDSYETSTHHQLTRIQSANLAYDLGGARTDVNQFGELARISSVITDSPSVTLDLTYYLTNGLNEKNLGFYVQNVGAGNTAVGQFPSGQLQDVSGQNFYMLTSPEGDDINTYDSSSYDGTIWFGGANSKSISYIGVGNAFLSDYTLDAAVGDFPTVSVSVEGLNANAGSNAITVAAVTESDNLAALFAGGGLGDDGNGTGAVDKASYGYMSSAPYQFIATQAPDGRLGTPPNQVYGNLGIPYFGGWTGQANFSYSGISRVLMPSINAADGTKYTKSTYPSKVLRAEDFKFLQNNGDGFLQHLAASGQSVFIDGVVLPALTSSITATDTEGDNSIDVLRPGDVVLNLGLFDSTNNAGDGPFVRISGSDGVCVQNLSLSIPLSRTPIQCLGTKFAKSRSVDFPVTATLTVSALVNETASGNLVDTLDANGEHDITISFRDPVAADGSNAVVYTMKNAKFDGEAYASSIGPNKTVDLTFTTQIGGVNDTNNGIQVSGSW